MLQETPQRSIKKEKYIIHFASWNIFQYEEDSMIFELTESQYLESYAHEFIIFFKSTQGTKEKVLKAFKNFTLKVAKNAQKQMCIGKFKVYFVR